MTEPTLSSQDASVDENKIIAERREKLHALRAAGVAYPNDFRPTHEAGSLQADYADADKDALEATALQVAVAGRMMLKRVMGKASFATVQDSSGQIQFFVTPADVGADTYDAFKKWDLGDIVAARGVLFRTNKGELSVRCTELRLLSKALRPLPDKFHGLADQETRYRQRYVDLIVTPEARQTFVARTRAISSIRKFMSDANFMEVETPMLHPIPGGAAAKPFVTHHNALDMQMFMRIAPELYLKRLLVGGLERVYEIGRCYRNEGISTRHNPEFTMLEYYWAYANYEDLMNFTELMLRSVDEALAKAMPEAHARWKAERPFTFDEPFARVPMDDMVATAARATKIPAWVEAVDKDGGAGLLRLLGKDFGENIKEWAKASPRAKGLDWGNFRKGWLKCENKGEQLFAAYEYLSEPFLTEDYKAQDGKHSRPVFVIDYPFEVSPLARRNDQHPELVDRFELFVHGRELCNAFSELNDPEDQAERFREQVRKKAAGAEETMDFDEDYIRALEHGMPPAAGFGMGVDRLTMMLTSSPSIRDVVLFPLLRPESHGG